MKINKIDRLFKTKLGGLEPEPTPEAWQAIEQALRKKKDRHLWKRLAIAASLILLAGLGFYEITNEDMPPLQTAVDNHKKAIDSRPKAETDNNSVDNQDQTLAQSQDDESTSTTNNSQAPPVNIGERPDKKLPKPVQEKIDVGRSTAMETAKSPKAPENIANKNTSDQQSTNDAGLAGKIEKAPVRETPPVAMMQPDNSTEAPDQLEPDVENIPKAPRDEITTEQEFPEVKITYKKTHNESLLASAEENIVKKGIQKISGFKDDIKLSDEAKTRIRNTKDDILALNFGRIFNKTQDNKN